MIELKELLYKMHDIDERIKFVTVEYDDWCKYGEGERGTTPYIIRFWSKKPVYYSTAGSWFSEGSRYHFGDDFITFFQWLEVDLSGYPKMYDDPEDDTIDTEFCIEEFV